MKLKTGLIAGVLVLMSGVALANRPPQGGPGPGMNIDKLEILLDLDAYQKQEVQKILESQHAAMRTKREEWRNAETRPSREEMQARRAEMRAQHEAAQKETRTQLEKILSEQQLKKFDILAERPPMRQRHAGKAGAAKSGATKSDAVKAN